jgi:hypothetical protein
MIQKVTTIVATILLVGYVYLEFSADCATGGDCTFANGDLFIRVASLVPPAPAEDPFEKIFPGR